MSNLLALPIANYETDSSNATAINEVRRPVVDTTFRDEISNNLISNFDDAIRAAWNGWEQACKFKNEEMQDYYMQIIRDCSSWQKKVKKY
jgi:hypothetical protein